jgi:hypothetical protein
LTIVVSGIGSGGKLMPVEAEFIGTNVRYSLYRDKKTRQMAAERSTAASPVPGHGGFLEQLKQCPGKENAPAKEGESAVVVGVEGGDVAGPPNGSPDTPS